MTEQPTGALPSDDEQAFYRAVLAQGGRVMFREALEENAAVVLRLLHLGLLVHHTADASLTAVNPRAASERISAQLRTEGARMIARAEEVPAFLEELTDAYDASPRRVDRRGEVQHVDDEEQIRHRVVQLEVDAKEEGLAMQPGGARPPRILSEGLQRTREMLARGARVRTIYQPAARADETTAAYAATVTALGGRFRVLAEPFSRMIVFDRRVAVIPASADLRSAAFVEDPAVVGFLVGVFERCWARAEQVFWGAEQPEEGEAAPVHEQVGRLLAQGLTQKSVAGRLALSERTVAGHIARLRELHDAETLFQLGWRMRGDHDGERHG